MPYRGLFFLQALVLAIIGATHVAALQYYLYWHYIWLDLPVHFLGGLWIALASAWIFGTLNIRLNIWLALVFVIGVGIAWEIFELVAGVPVEANFALDTSLDMIMDVLGGFAGFGLARYFLRAS